jgi:hypothetical protein
VDPMRVCAACWNYGRKARLVEFLMTNIWKEKGPVTSNPYHQAAFKAVGMSRSVIAPDQVAQMIEQRRQALRAMPGVFQFDGRKLTQADITTARQILLDPNRRMLEELLEHQPEEFPTDELDRLYIRLVGIGWEMPHPDQPNTKFLLRVAQELARKFADELPLADPAPYPVDNDLIPPFGEPDQ